MARLDVPLLDTGSRFPAVSFEVVGDDPISYPAAFAGRWSVLLINRGHW